MTTASNMGIAVCNRVARPRDRKGIRIPRPGDRREKNAVSGRRLAYPQGTPEPGRVRSPWTLLETIYDEWLSLLNTPFVHLGLDEVRLPKEAQARRLSRIASARPASGGTVRTAVTPLVWADAPPTPKAYRDSVLRVLWYYGDGGGEPDQPAPEHPTDRGLCAADCPEKVIMAGGSDSRHTCLLEDRLSGRLPQPRSMGQLRRCPAELCRPAGGAMGWKHARRVASRFSGRRRRGVEPARQAA